MAAPPRVLEWQYLLIFPLIRSQMEKKLMLHLEMLQQQQNHCLFFRQLHELLPILPSIRKSEKQHLLHHPATQK